MLKKSQGGQQFKSRVSIYFEQNCLKTCHTSMGEAETKLDPPYQK
jgi:hypothetical protein